jgi:hypothetical protein
MQEVHAGGKPLKKAYVGIFLWFTGRVIQAAAKVDKEVKKEFDALPDDFTFSLGCLPNGPCMVVGKVLEAAWEGKPLDLNKLKKR